MFTIKVRERVQKLWGSRKAAKPSHPTTRLSLEVLEDRTLPSVLGASPPVAPQDTAITSYMDSIVEQRVQLIATMVQSASNIVNALDQAFIQEVSSFDQQWEGILGINPSATMQPSSDNGAGQYYASGSGSGSGATTTAHDDPHSSLENAQPMTGSGSGGGGSSGSGSGSSGSGSGSGSGMGSNSCSMYNRIVQFSGSGTIDVAADSSMCTPNTVTLAVNVVNANSMCPGIAVNYATQDGTAIAGIDYTAESGTLIFTPGQTSPDYISIPLLDDGDDGSGGSKSFTVNLSNPVNAILGNPSIVTVNILEGPVQAATDTLRWNPCMGNNASTVQNWYDVTQGFQLQNGAMGPNASSPIQFDANPGDTPNSNAPITWDQSFTVASISLNQYTGKETLNSNVIVDSKGANGTALSMDGSSNLYLSYNPGSVYQIDNNATITNMNLTGGGYGSLKITGGTTMIAGSSSYNETTQANISIASEAV